jgi:hypothetical protein
MILTDSEVASLKETLNWWEWFGYVSTAIVFIGCVGEFIAEFTHLPKGVEAERRLARLSLIVLIFGIAGELLGTVRTSQLSGQLIANLEDRTGDAEQRAGEAHKEAARLTKLAEDERLARVQIEEALAPRRLSEGQELAIGKSLRHFKGQAAQMVYDGGNSEAQAFSIDIWRALKQAEWHVYFPATMWSGTKFGREDSLGVVGRELAYEGVEIFPSETGNKAARELAAELNRLGFGAVVEKQPAPRKDADGMQITVVTRPLGPQGAAKLRATKQ